MNRNDYQRLLLGQVNNASVVFFRVAFGLVMSVWAWQYLSTGRVYALFVEPEFHFTYYGFDWVQPWPGNGMYYHFLALLLLALCITCGLFYRVSALLFAIGFTYVFLLERTNYQNHYYLVGLISWWLPFLPLNRRFALDAWRKPSLYSEEVSALVLGVVGFHVAMPYFFGGIAKLNSDWLLGQPMGIMLQGKASLPIVGEWISGGAVVLFVTWFGILFDLLVVPGVIWRKTRPFAFMLAVFFHLGNSVLFNIHIFPWFMILATTVFFPPDWPIQLLSKPGDASVKRSPAFIPSDKVQWTFGNKVLASILIFYCGFHILWPLRHNLYAGEASWNERGHQFAWRMMLRGKEAGVGFALVDPASKRVANIDHKQFMAPEQAEKFGRDPEMILHFAHFLADKFEESTGRRPEIYALVLCSLNGRKPELMVDPNTDLASQPRGVFFDRTWVPRLSEPLRAQPWDIPIDQWKQHVEMPKLAFLDANQPVTQ